jgi:hypothetical protein
MQSAEGAEPKERSAEKNFEKSVDNEFKLWYYNNAVS